MKKIVFCALTALALFAISSCSGYETVKGDPMKTRICTLDNGLKVYMTVNKDEPRLQTYIAVRAGGKNGPDESTGLAHYFEHLMFKGTTHFGTSDYEAEKPMLDEIESLFNLYRKTRDEAARKEIYHRIDSISYQASLIAIPNEYDKLMSAIGASGTNAWTSMDETVYTEDIPSNQIENWAKIQSDRFRNIVLRGFHTELETIYEEKNMSLTRDSRKLFEALDEGLFPNHPYGQRTVLGTQEHLKNPSITDVKNFHDQFYVPNNVAICVSGDFDPDNFMELIEKYFGDWEPNPSVPLIDVRPEEPITTPVVKEVYGLEYESVALGWRIPRAADIRNSDIAEVAGRVLMNGQAGLLDLDLIQKQAVLNCAAAAELMADHGEFLALVVPKQGQTLEEAKDLLLAEVAKLRAGQFDESLINAIVNNMRLEMMHGLERNSVRAGKFVSAFINGIDWKDAACDIDRLAKISKEDIVAWAGEYLADNNYVVVYKRQGEDLSQQKIAAPQITPIATNRDSQSDFLTEIISAPVKPISPEFLDFSEAMDEFVYADGVNALYKKNETNDIFSLEFVFNRGYQEEPALAHAVDYFSYLGTEEMSAEDIAKKMYSLACSYNVACDRHSTVFSLSGLSDNMEEALALFENLIYNAKGDEDVLANVKADELKARSDAKTSQSSCFSKLASYVSLGAGAVKASTLDNEAMLALTSDGLLSQIRNLFSQSHEIRYYGPASETALRRALAAVHPVLPNLKPIEKKFDERVTTPENTVVMAQYDSKQIYYLQYSNRGETFDAANAPGIEMYNEYFGGGMNAIVFQEMREARGLAYSASAVVGSPDNRDGCYVYNAFIATQNDKMQVAMEAFDDIINDMPVSEKAFEVAREGLLTRLRTQRVKGYAVLRQYARCRDLGLTEPVWRSVFESVQNMTMDDVKAAQEKWARDRNYTFAILGDIKDLDTDYLRTVGPVRIVSLEDIFGY